MSKHSKANRTPPAAAKSASRHKSGNRQSLWLRIVIGLASVATIFFGAQVFLDARNATPLVTVTSTPNPSANASLAPVPADQVGQTATPVPTIAGVGAVAPPAFVGMNRTSYTPGTQALAEINKLHDAAIPLSDGYGAVYTWQNLTVSIWSGVAASGTDAATVVKQMNDTIVKGGTAYSNPQSVTVAGQTVYQVQGPGGSNYFYQSTVYPTNIVWLTIQAPDTATNSLLQSALQIF